LIRSEPREPLFH